MFLKDLGRLEVYFICTICVRFGIVIGYLCSTRTKYSDRGQTSGNYRYVPDVVPGLFQG